MTFSNAIFDFPLLSLGVIVLAILAIWFLLRHRPPSPFIKGGKNRRPRLYVVDAAAVDARRRVVLVRRDNVEHLVMIGGPNDILLETRIPAPIGTRHRPQSAQQEAKNEPQKPTEEKREAE
ncbi:flagellar biogenesis protein FliO [Martelella radicis]|uniref:Flagellar biogenesis protein FliO n=1 Tax=Martelella radicis TaxID=1397476 RepID=A0A7W6KIN4_9HYPH|nr:flagellar biogenesis protein FliO [Martelella radicis]